MLERELTLYKFNHNYLKMLAADISESDMRLAPFEGANPPVWILGHLAICNDFCANVGAGDRLSKAVARHVQTRKQAQRPWIRLAHQGGPALRHRKRLPAGQRSGAKSKCRSARQAARRGTAQADEPEDCWRRIGPPDVHARVVPQRPAFRLPAQGGQASHCLT